MWVFSTPQVTVYAIQPGRGFEQAARVLDPDFAGFLVRDGWAVYRRFLHALHQSCLAHLLRRCREMILVAGKRGAEFPRGIQALLQQALQLRHRRQQEQINCSVVPDNAPIVDVNINQQSNQFSSGHTCVFVKVKMMLTGILQCRP